MDISTSIQQDLVHWNTGGQKQGILLVLVQSTNILRRSLERSRDHINLIFLDRRKERWKINSNRINLWQAFLRHSCYGWCLFKQRHHVWKMLTSTFQGAAM